MPRSSSEEYTRWLDFSTKRASQRPKFRKQLLEKWGDRWLQCCLPDLGKAAAGLRLYEDSFLHRVSVQSVNGFGYALHGV